MAKRLVAALFVMAVAPAWASGSVEEDLVAMAERQGAAVTGGAGDCDKMGEALLGGVDSDIATLKKAIAADAGKSKDEKKAAQLNLMAKFGPRLKAAQEKMAPLKACRSNAKVQAWKKKLDDATDPRKG
ncbi:MAG: hypothetical protein K1X89_18230 [Myxococcaceae bacterium]|nr:hypothetical protein [Myxococcaceae bacterium]